jgi:small-conductance mechanosensitive channel
MDPSQITEYLQVFLAPGWAGAGVVLCVAVVAAYLVEFITTRVLLRLVGKTETDLDDRIIAAARRPMFATVVLVGASIALERIGVAETQRFVTSGILVTTGVLIWTAAGMRIGHAVLEALSQRMGENNLVQPRTLPVFDIALKALVVGGAAYGLLVAWNIDVTAWLASAGILGIAIGFAAKDTLANLFSGIFILADAPYKLGDFIILDSGERGRVTDIGIRSTRLLTRDDIEIIIPNAAIANAKIVNETGGPFDKERVRVTVGVAYGSDVDRVREVLLEVAAKSGHLADDPQPRVRFREMGDSALVFQLLGWIEEPVLRGRAVDELNTAVYKRFAEENITIPFPQRDVHLIKDG